MKRSEYTLKKSICHSNNCVINGTSCLLIHSERSWKKNSNRGSDTFGCIYLSAGADIALVATRFYSWKMKRNRIALLETVLEGFLWIIWFPLRWEPSRWLLCSIKLTSDFLSIVLSPLHTQSRTVCVFFLNVRSHSIKPFRFANQVFLYIPRATRKKKGRLTAVANVGYYFWLNSFAATTTPSITKTKKTAILSSWILI